MDITETKNHKDFGCCYSFHKSYSYQLCAIEYDGSFSEQPPLLFCFSPLKCGSLSNTEKVLNVEQQQNSCKSSVGDLCGYRDWAFIFLRNRFWKTDSIQIVKAIFIRE